MYSRTMLDYDSEPTVFRVNSAQLTAANIDAQIALNVALGNGIVGITRGTLQKIMYGNEIVSPGIPADPLAQRENKWLIRYQDSVTNKIWRVELGTADLTKLDPNARGYANIGDAGDVDAFVTAFNNFVLSPDGNPSTIVDIKFVGRST